MLQINGKTFMNLQEAVQWLLDNNALPFQSSANYVGNTEIGMGTIVNPSPAKVRIGSLIFFADSKVSTVIGLTENGFICSDQYNDLVDDVVYVSNVALNASGHLIVTLSNGDTIDAGLIKQVTGFSINGSQHLIVSYNDGSSTDLGAIFSGNITISGDLLVTGKINNVATPSVKPIYCHPISLNKSTAHHRLALTCLIFNNDPTPFTLATFKTWLDDLFSQVGDTIRIMTSGAFNDLDNSKIIILSWLYRAASNYGLYGISTAGYVEVFTFQWDDFLDSDVTFNDGVNKIN